MTVRFTMNPQRPNSTPFKDQDYFDDFDFDRMEAGDVVWIDDYDGNDAAKTRDCGIIARFDFNDPIIRLLPNSVAEKLDQWEQEGPLVTVIGTHKYFENFMYH